MAQSRLGSACLRPKRDGEAVNELLNTERLGEITCDTRIHRPLTRAIIGISGDHDRRDDLARCNEFLMQLLAAQSRHVDISYEAVDHVVAHCVQELFGAVKTDRGIPQRSDERVQGREHLIVVVNDRDNLLVQRCFRPDMASS
jgi:hypothetical protein